MAQTKKFDKKEIAKQNFEITKIDIHFINSKKRNLSARVDIYINDLIKINDIYVSEHNGKKNINMPYMYDGLLYTFFVKILDNDIYKLVSDEIIKKFDEQCAKLKEEKKSD